MTENPLISRTSIHRIEADGGEIIGGVQMTIISWRDISAFIPQKMHQPGIGFSIAGYALDSALRKY